jgi:UDP-N-acetylglucosamine 2-epimerase (non-hydrolysing)
VPQENIFLTGNPVVDALHAILERASIPPDLEAWLKETQGLRRIVVTTHRRESFGEVLAGNLRVLRSFVDRHEDVALVFPVHPNPAVVGPATATLSGHPRINLIQPLNYEDFVLLLSNAWLIVSDSGGVQEEAPTLGKPLLILRENTELPEALECGVARLVGKAPSRLEAMLEEVYSDGNWIEQTRKTENPFGQGDSGKRIVQAIAELLAVPITDPDLIRTSYA